METCDDDPNWKFNGKNGKDCGWVILRRNKRCGLEDKNGAKVNEVCPIACQSTSNCEIPDCLKNSQWQPKDGSFENCKSLKYMTKKDRKSACAKIGTDELTFGYEACQTCKICQK